MLYAFGAWTVFVWGTRIDNILAEDPWSGLDLAVAVGLLGLGLAVLAVALRRRLGRGSPGEAVPVVGVAALATAVTWAVRTPLMFTNDHPAGFLAVHTALAVVSVALAALAWRAVRPAPVPSGRVGATRG